MLDTIKQVDHVYFSLNQFRIGPGLTRSDNISEHHSSHYLHDMPHNISNNQQDREYVERWYEEWAEAPLLVTVVVYIMHQKDKSQYGYA